MSTEEIIAAIEKMTVLELADLVKALQDRFGVVAAAPVAAAAPAGAAAAAAGAGRLGPAGAAGAAGAAAEPVLPADCCNNLSSGR